MIASIIIPTYNRSFLLEKTLNSLVNQNFDMTQVEVIICDDGSTDNTKEVCEKFSNNLNIIYKFQENEGFRAAKARNLGIKAANSDICIFIDCGVLLSSRAVENHVKNHMNNKRVAVIGYMHGFDDYENHKDDILAIENIENIDDVIVSVCKDNIHDSRESLYKELGDDLTSWPAPWVVFWSGNISIRREVLLEVGMFDEFYQTWGGEDTDLGLALFIKKVDFILDRKCDSIDYPHKKLNNYINNPEEAEHQFTLKRDYMNKKYNLTAIKVWYEKRYDELNQALINRAKEKKSIIWNVTRYCSWNCSICCVNAKYIPKMQQINTECNEKFSLDDELNFLEKKKIIDTLQAGKHRIDFSGGEINIDPLNIELIKYASEKLGKDSIGISTSGAFINERVLEVLSMYVNDVELTLDYVPYRGYDIRPIGYHEYAEYTIRELKKQGVNVGIQTVITKHNKSFEKLKEIYEWAVEYKIDTWSLLRFFNSGRGKAFKECEVGYSEYKDIVNYVKELTKDEKEMDVQFQYLLPNHKKHTYDCRAVKKSIGILPNGDVISCFWALDKNMKVKNPEFLLGNLKDDSIESILANKKSKYWSTNDHKCKIFNDLEGIG